MAASGRGANPETSIQRWRGVAFRVDLSAIRRRMVEMEITWSAGPFGVGGHALRSSKARSTWYLLLGGEQVGLRTFREIIAYLGLTLSEIAVTTEVAA